MCQPSTKTGEFSAVIQYTFHLSGCHKEGIILLWHLNLKRCLLVGDAVCLLVIRETSNSWLAERAGKTLNSFIYKKLIENWNSSISIEDTYTIESMHCLVLVVKTGCLLPNWLSLFHFLIMIVYSCIFHCSLNGFGFAVPILSALHAIFSIEFSNLILVDSLKIECLLGARKQVRLRGLVGGNFWILVLRM